MSLPLQEMKMAAAKRIYTVTITEGDQVTTRLVKAQNPSQAIRHVSDPMFKAEIAGQDDLVRLVGSGVTVEEAAE